MSRFSERRAARRAAPPPPSSAPAHQEPDGDESSVLDHLRSLLVRGGKEAYDTGVNDVRDAGFRQNDFDEEETTGEQYDQNPEWYDRHWRDQEVSHDKFLDAQEGGPDAQYDRARVGVPPPFVSDQESADYWTSPEADSFGELDHANWDRGIPVGYTSNSVRDKARMADSPEELAILHKIHDEDVGSLLKGSAYKRSHGGDGYLSESRGQRRQNLSDFTRFLREAKGTRDGENLGDSDDLEYYNEVVRRNKERS